MTRHRPTQAVVLAGGRGTRLRPFTDTSPKPMLPFHGRPFLDYLLERLAGQGIERVLLLLGYLPEVIERHVEDGARWGVRVECAVSDVDDETGRRLALAKDRLDETFLLCYCDNEWPLPLDRMWRQLEERPADGLLTVYDNADGYTRDNVRVDAEGFITAYDKDRAAPGLSGVDIGFGIFPREVVDWVGEGNASFERVVYPRMVAARRLQAFVTGHRYYSVSSRERLPLTARFLAREPAVILDRDGVLNRRPPRGEYVRSWDEWAWLPGATDALRRLTEAGYRIMIVSNQAGIARGAMTLEDARRIHQRLLEEAREAGGRIDAIYFCPHGWDDGCRCRKPKPGMLFAAQRDFHLDLSRTPFFGDDERDGQAAASAGCPWVRITDERTVLHAVSDLLGNRSRSVRRDPALAPLEVGSGKLEWLDNRRRKHA